MRKSSTTIKIRDNGEPLVEIRRACPGVVVDLGPGRRQESAYLRKTVAKMINRAKSYLPAGMTFIIRDAWRSPAVQKKIFEDFVIRFTTRYPRWQRKRIIAEVEKYVAPYAGPTVSGHLTGGAVDLRVLKQDGRRLPLRWHRLSYQENAQADQPKLPKYLQKNRALMFNALNRSGLSNYSKEFWHWSYGDIWWAKRHRRKVAIYGPIVDPVVK